MYTQKTALLHVNVDFTRASSLQQLDWMKDSMSYVALVQIIAKNQPFSCLYVDIIFELIIILVFYLM